MAARLVSPKSSPCEPCDHGVCHRQTRPRHQPRRRTESAVKKDAKAGRDYATEVEEGDGEPGRRSKASPGHTPPRPRPRGLPTTMDLDAMDGGSQSAPAGRSARPHLLAAMGALMADDRARRSRQDWPGWTVNLFGPHSEWFAYFDIWHAPSPKPLSASGASSRTSTWYRTALASQDLARTVSRTVMPTRVESSSTSTAAHAGIARP